ncbi:MAG TPA: gamma-glutamyltransferase [Solirubrobacteraceae bacterium]|jgi:gamma-glutamyltranspeptidase/glutathione hydrolase|nr:gamma-glutamyltransferase [Solirubrobacteraceae bacterium]
MDRAEQVELTAIARQGFKERVGGRDGVVVSSHPVASRVGANMLRAGGNACDAALATAITQTVVEPQMTSIAGMMKLVYFDATTGETHWLSGAHRAPAASLERLSGSTVNSGIGAALPGWWGAFDAASERLASKSRAELMGPAIELARHGAIVYPQLYGVMYRRAPELGRSEAGRRIFFHDDTRLRVPGETLDQSEAAGTLERLAAEGSDFFYHGDFAQGLCELLARDGGVITVNDMAAYRAVWSAPVGGTYRGHQLIASGAPDGGLNIIEALNMVETLDLSAFGPPSESPELLYELMLICQDILDRGAGWRDPVTVPDATGTIVSKEFARDRLQLLRMAGPHHGIATPHVGTDHVSAVDANGSVAVLMHTCTADPWINGLFYRGVHIPASGGWFMRTPLKPGARITIDGAENIALLDGRPVLASGSPSGSLLPCVLQNMINIIDFGMSIEESVARPRFGFSDVGSSRLVIEASVGTRVRDGLAALGMPFDVIGPYHEQTGSYDALHRVGDEWFACADPRRTGTAEAV